MWRPVWHFHFRWHERAQVTANAATEDIEFPLNSAARLLFSLSALDRDSLVAAQFIRREGRFGQTGTATRLSRASNENRSGSGFIRLHMASEKMQSIDE